MKCWDGASLSEAFATVTGRGEVSAVQGSKLGLGWKMGSVFT